MKSEQLIRDRIVEEDRGHATPCWVWQGTTQPDGYGTVSYNGKNWRAHRMAYSIFVGPIGDGLLVCHHCDQPLCCRPDHLFLGTVLDNMRDKCNKGRHRNQNVGKTHCKRGHEFTEKNTRRYGKGRVCRTCELHRTWRRRGKVVPQSALLALSLLDEDAT